MDHITFHYIIIYDHMYITQTVAVEQLAVKSLLRMVEVSRTQTKVPKHSAIANAAFASSRTERKRQLEKQN